MPIPVFRPIRSAPHRPNCILRRNGSSDTGRQKAKTGRDIRGCQAPFHRAAQILALVGLPDMTGGYIEHRFLRRISHLHRLCQTCYSATGAR